MRKLIIICLALSMSGCLLALPREHDPALAESYVDTLLLINTLDCSKRYGFSEMDWNTTQRTALFMSEYARFRSDPQKETAAAIPINIVKAKEAKSEKVCNHWLNLTKSRMSALEKAWKGR